MAGTAAKIVSEAELKPGDRVVWVGGVGSDINYPECIGAVCTVKSTSGGIVYLYSLHACLENRGYNSYRVRLQPKGNQMLQDIRTYVKENRQVLYTVAFIVALDHFVFNGAFRERLKGLVDGMLKRVEEKTK